MPLQPINPKYENSWNRSAANPAAEPRTGAQPAGRDLERGEPYQLAWMPDAAERQPLWVVDVCLPYVLVKTAKKRVLTLDVRRCRLVQVSDQFGKAYFREFRSRRKRRKRQKEKQDKTESTHEASGE
jgi:hypothetical protein